MYPCVCRPLVVNKIPYFDCACRDKHYELFIQIAIVVKAAIILQAVIIVQSTLETGS